MFTEKEQELIDNLKVQREIMKLKRRIATLNSKVNRAREEIESLEKQLKLLGSEEFDD